MASEGTINNAHVVAEAGASFNHHRDMALYSRRCTICGGEDFMEALEFGLQCLDVCGR